MKCPYCLIDEQESWEKTSHFVNHIKNLPPWMYVYLLAKKKKKKKKSSKIFSMKSAIRITEAKLFLDFISKKKKMFGFGLALQSL